MMRDSSIWLILGIGLFVNFVVAQENEGGGGEEHAGEGFQVFHVEWKRVEVPYVIGLWILTTTLVKIGKQFHLCTAPHIEAPPVTGGEPNFGLKSCCMRCHPMRFKLHLHAIDGVMQDYMSSQAARISSSSSFCLYLHQFRKWNCNFLANILHSQGFT